MGALDAVVTSDAIILVVVPVFIFNPCTEFVFQEY